MSIENENHSGDKLSPQMKEILRVMEESQTASFHCPKCGTTTVHKQEGDRAFCTSCGQKSKGKDEK